MPGKPPLRKSSSFIRGWYVQQVWSEAAKEVSPQARIGWRWSRKEGSQLPRRQCSFLTREQFINLLDTPGHQDFSEDTYRTLTAADCAVMVIDAAKGVEAQTRKLFEVCRLRGIPTITFVNKMDLPARDIFDLLSEVEVVLGVKAAPMSWPIGAGKNFVGVVDRDTKKVSLFKRAAGGGAARALVTELSLDEFYKSGECDAELITQTQFELELLEEAGNPFRYEDFLAGKTSPVFFGSALTNFGVEPFFDSFVKLAPPPRPVPAIKDDVEHSEITISSESDFFSAFVFKIQANMNPKHRDSMAFLRVCSGALERDMVVRHHRSEKEVRLSRSYSMSGQDRNTVDLAYPGDVVGVINPGVFAIGDTISTSRGFAFKPMPQFPPEVIAQIRPVDVMRRKAFEKGVKQLCDEGAVQMLRSYENPNGAPYVAAVGRLQFDVLQIPA